MSERPRPTAIDLFAGAGGLSLGFEQAGFDVRAAVEIDPIHCATHQFNFPQTDVVCASVAAVKGAELLARTGLRRRELDVLCGGAPCQGFSMMGKRQLDDPRNSLPAHFLRLAKELLPRYIVFENVPGLAVGQHRAVLDELIGEFESLGYAVAKPVRVLSATNYAVPQRRKRLFLLAARKGETCPAYPSPIARERTDETLLISDLPDAPTVWEAIGDLPEIEGRDVLFDRDWIKIGGWQQGPYAKLLEGGDTDFSYRRAYDRTMLTSSLRTRHSEESVQRFADAEPGQTESISRFFKLAPDGYCNTLRAGTASDRGAFTSPRPIHPTIPRCITNREAARLHSYPDWFRFHVTKWHGFRQIGNSVPPLLGKAVAAAIIRALDHRPTKPKKTLELGEETLLEMNMRQASAFYGVPHDVIPQRNRKSLSAV